VLQFIFIVAIISSIYFILLHMKPHPYQ